MSYLSADDFAKVINVRITFVEPVLGTQPNDPEIYRNFVGSKAPDAASVEDEVKALGADVVAERQMTVFPALDDGTPFMYAYQVKGFFKGACGFLRLVNGTLSSKLKAYKKKIDGLVFPFPDRIIFQNVEEIGECQRSLRAQTMQGERTSLAISEMIDKGAVLEFSIGLEDPGDEAIVKEWLNFGKKNGFCQWRNSGKGRFVWEELDDHGNVIGGNFSDLVQD